MCMEMSMLSYCSLIIRVRTVNKEIIFQYLPAWIELNFKDISDVVYHASVAINMLSGIRFRRCI